MKFHEDDYVYVLNVSLSFAQNLTGCFTPLKTSQLKPVLKL